MKTRAILVQVWSVPNQRRTISFFAGINTHRLLYFIQNPPSLFFSSEIPIWCPGTYSPLLVTFHPGANPSQRINNSDNPSIRYPKWNSMKLELLSASNFLVHLIRLGRRNVGEGQLSKFRDCLIEVLRRRYRDHWFPEKPFKGSGYRCIRINGKMDPVIAQAGDGCGLSSTLLHQTFPSELTMWIDPLEVFLQDRGERKHLCLVWVQGRLRGAVEAHHQHEC